MSIKIPSQVISTDKCEKCGQMLVRRKGVSKAGNNWEAKFCVSGNREHTIWLSDNYYTSQEKADAWKERYCDKIQDQEQRWGVPKGAEF